MKKFYQTLSSSLMPMYTDSRVVGSMAIICYLIQYFECKNILEVGFDQGQTFGLMLESAAPGGVLTAIDPVYDYNIYDKFYRDSEHTKDKIVELLEIRYEDFKSSTTYDFINVDSGRKGDVDRYKHLCMSLELLHKNSILMLDNYDTFDDAVTKFLDLKTDFVPFLMDDQALYFHHNSHDASDFLDNVLEAFSYQFSCYNQDYKGFLVKSVMSLPVCLNFKEILPVMHNLMKLMNV